MQRNVIRPAPVARSMSISGWRKVVIGGLMALLPKCFGCVAGWFAVAAGIRTIAPEICGDTPGPQGFRMTYFWALAAIFMVWAVPMAWKRARRISFRPARVAFSAVSRRIR